VSGIPGAGKTTVSRLLAQRFERSVHIEGDVVGHHFIVNGLVPPHDPHPEAERQLLLRRRNICALANNFAADGFVVVIDDVVVSPSVLEIYERDLTEPPALFVLDVRVEVVKQRDETREKHVFDLWGHLDAEMRASMKGHGTWISASDLTAQETVDRIMEAL
jgi:predicted kinase